MDEQTCIDSGGTWDGAACSWDEVSPDPGAYDPSTDPNATVRTPSTAAAPDTTAADPQGVTIVRGQRQPTAKTGKNIPSNILSEVRDAASRTGVPEWVLIAVLQKENGSFNPKAVNQNSNGSVDHGLAQINDKERIGDFANKDDLIACANSVSCSIDYLAHSVAGTFKNERQNQSPDDRIAMGDEQVWLNAAANWHRSVRDSEWSDYRQGLVDLTDRGYVEGPKKSIPPTKDKALTAAEKKNRAPATMQDIYDLFQEFTGRAPKDDADAIGWGRVGQPYGSIRAELAASPEAALWRQYSGRIQDVQSWARPLWRDYLGHEPTNEEMRQIIDNHWTQDQAEEHLRSQTYGQTTLGEMFDVRKLADKYAAQFVGRGKADEGELQWLIANGKTSVDDISAFYEQLKERRDTGDPAFAWVGDPTSWRSTRDQLGSLWTKAGLKGQPDPRLVNQAQAGGWTIDDMNDAVNALPAPGFQNITVGEANRVRKIAQGWKDNYLPGVPLTHEEMTQFVGMSSDEMRTYYRSLPVQMHRDAAERQKAVQAGPQFKDVHQQAVQAAKQMPDATKGTAGADQPKPDRSQQSGSVPTKGYKLDPSGNVVAG